MNDTYDYLIVGGGAAGCVVARRLAERTGGRVLLIEAGRPDQGDLAATYLSRLDDQDERYDWGLVAETGTSDGARMSYARARMLGGCANHNDCAFIAPPASDLERWVQLGAKGWGPADVAGALARIEQTLHIETAPPGNALSRAFIEAGRELGLPERDYRGAFGAGCGWFPLNARGDLRQSSSVAYLHPLEHLPGNLEVRTETRAQHLVLDGKRVCGVETDQGIFNALREVILCAGSINTPHIMMLSGLGPGAMLQEFGLPVIEDLPGVGANLVDHAAANIAFALREPPPSWERTPCEATALCRVDEGPGAPDVLYHFVLRLREKYVDGEQFSGIAHGVKISPNVARPRSRGCVTLISADPYEQPRIRLNYFSDPDGYDRATLLAGLRLARRFAATNALKGWLGDEVAPGAHVTGDDALFDYVKETCETVYHPAGTCRMGAYDDPMTIVTPDLKVKGVQSLRVADASVFPDMVTVNICNTVMMIGERAADLIAAGD